jgi:crotonobetainyl-CoA:carnitine CoA-transferase CaiB-like acyl-CoA transferase
LKVVDLSCDVAGRFAAKLLAMSGLDVIRPESSTPAAGPQPLDVYLDAHKEIVSCREPAEALSLVATEDVVFTTFDRGRYAGLVSVSGVDALPSTCVHVTTSTFGTFGPYSTFRGGPMADWAAGGYLAITGEPEREPLIGPENLCGYIGGYTAAIAAEAALQHRRRTGEGQQVDISTMESMLSVHQSTFSRLAAGIVRLRTGRYTEAYPLVVRPCRDGHVSLGVVTDAEFDRLAIAVGREDLITDERFCNKDLRWDHRDELDVELEGFLSQHDADRAVEILSGHGVAAAKVAAPSDVLTNPQLAHRGFWEQPGGPARLGRMPGNPIPAAKQISTSPSSTTARYHRPGGLPLAGVVLDFTAFWAGPSATRWLADLGAQVIWLERPQSRVDADLSTSDTSTIVQHSFHLKMNRNKQSVVLDLRNAADRQIARRLAGEADVLVENFRPGVMDRFGLGPSELCRNNPALVYVSLSGFGSGGPWSDRRSYGPTIEAASSIEGRTGYPGGEPLRLGHTLPDGAGGLAGALSALRGLRGRAETGMGGWFDVSQLEVYTAISGEELLVASTSDRALARVGNRSRCGAVQGVFACRGDDEWIAVRLADPSDLERLAEVARIPALIERKTESTLDHDFIEGLIGAYTANHDKHELAASSKERAWRPSRPSSPPSSSLTATFGRGPSSSMWPSMGASAWFPFRVLPCTPTTSWSMSLDWHRALASTPARSWTLSAAGLARRPLPDGQPEPEGHPRWKMRPAPAPRGRRQTAHPPGRAPSHFFTFFLLFQ